MSICQFENLEKFQIIVEVVFFSSMKTFFLITILGILIINSIYSLPYDYAMQQQQPQQQPTADKDFVLDVHNVSTNPIVTKFLIKDEVYDEICPFGQCSIEYEPNSSVTFSLPDDNNPFMYYSFQFTINYNNISV
jgi:hypothetical protein